MIEARVASYLQVRDDAGVVLPAVTVADPTLNDLLFTSLDADETRLHTLLLDEETGVHLLEVELAGVRFRIPLEEAPAAFVALGKLHGFAVCPAHAGPGVTSRYLHVGPFATAGGVTL